MNNHFATSRHDMIRLKACFEAANARYRRSFVKKSFIKKSFTMQKCIILFTALMAYGMMGLAQKSPLRGSGQVVTQVLTDTGFTAINLQDLDGRIHIAVGEPYSVRIAIDDNLQDLLQVSNQNGQLRISLKGNRNNRLYIEDTRIQINIGLPHLDALVHDGNSTATVRGIDAGYFEVKNGGNGTLRLSGRVADWTVRNSGNGNVYADSLLVLRGQVSCWGNGNVKVNVSDYLEATASGNGSVFNLGAASFSGASGSWGNGRLVRSEE
jgi:hypothetical protein